MTLVDRLRALDEAFAQWLDRVSGGRAQSVARRLTGNRDPIAQRLIFVGFGLLIASDVVDHLARSWATILRLAALALVVIVIIRFARRRHDDT